LTHKAARTEKEVPEQTEEERQLAELIVESLSLEDVSASDIRPEVPLFGDGLGLDSIDALELALAITRKYAIQLRADDENMEQIFGTLRSLSAYIVEKRA
jgi:acyl carrier protein